jgi:hypothetical protein
MENGVDLLTVVCGKEYCLNKWINYICKLSHKPALNKWIIVNNSDENFASLLKKEIKKRNFKKNFKYVIVNGPGKFVPPNGLDWRDEQVCIGKHRSTGESFSLGFKLCTSKYVYTIDDDVIPPDTAFSRLFHKIRLNEKIGAIAGLYFTHQGWETGNPWRTPSQLKRTVVASIKKDHWFPAMIDDYWDRGIVESGFLGTGCTMYNLEDVKECLPMKTILRENGLILGPDGEICESIRNVRNKKIFVDSGILCEHWECESKEAGLGCKNFLKTKLATNDVVIAGDFGNLGDRVEKFTEARDFAKKLNIKILQFWPRNEKTNWKWIPPWNTDSSISDILYIKEGEEVKKFEKITDYRRRQKKVMDEIYYNALNSGKYRNIYNLMDTTESVVNHRYIIELLKEKELFENA